MGTERSVLNRKVLIVNGGEILTCNRYVTCKPNWEKFPRDLYETRFFCMAFNFIMILDRLEIFRSFGILLFALEVIEVFGTSRVRSL